MNENTNIWSLAGNSFAGTSGSAGGDLSGTYPNPSISSSATPTVASLTVTGAATVGALKAATGAAGVVGTATLGSGTKTVSTTAVTASSIILVSYNTPKSSPTGILSAPAASISAGVHFVINSTDATDSTSTVNWLIVN